MDDAKDKVAMTDAKERLLAATDPVVLRDSLVAEIHENGLTWNQSEFLNRVIDRLIVHYRAPSQEDSSNVSTEAVSV